ncbi:hypothetical protein SAMN04490244_101267 [Tranquillimonas rosea]|uniref:Acyl-CoA transferase n=1 Tax=Tranquillimonas rosea TaxID=641238 RepID=A0A1H9PQD3_9RHOB|nr:acyl-CoA transferase [Tranquillimonas rosea]SER49773.1 hypothetical protein SAMN04490244_101267 [Tranquillimonas rosea]
MASTSETILEALAALLDAAKPAGASFERNATLPGTIPAAGTLILRDGDPGEPEVLISPPVYFYEHRAELDLVVDRNSATERDAVFDAAKTAVAAALAADRTLGGLCDYVIGEAPEPIDLPVEGAATLKAATIGIILQYGSPDPLS